MDDVEYILRLVLKARDDMAAVLAKARTQIRGFASDADKMNTSVTKLNGAMEKFNTNMDGVTKKLEAWRAVLRDAGGDSDKSTKSLESFTKAAERNVTATQKAVKTQEQLQQRARALRDEVNQLGEARKKEAVSTEFALAKYKALAKQLEEVSSKMSDAARRKTPAQIWADQAKDAADRINDIDKEITADAKAEQNKRIANEKAALNDIANAVRDHVKLRRDSEKAISDYTSEAIRERSREAARDQLQRAQDQRRADQAARLRERAAIVSSRIQRAEHGFGRKIDPRDIAEVDELANAYKKLSREYQIGTREARGFGAESERLRASVRGLGSDTDRNVGALSKLNAELIKSKSSAAGFDNQLRGIGILAAAVSIDQLISAAIALGGELVSLASSAVMAGGALGGALAAGASQALPVLGLLAGAALRVQDVLKAMTAQQALQKAQFADAEKGGQKAIDQANTLANAHDAVTAANERLAESRQALTKAQKEGVDQLEDLIYAEKQSALAAKGAALDVKGAQEALRLAVREGASQLEIDEKRQALAEARLSQGRAGTTARRARTERRAAGGQVSNLEPVKNAARQVEDAERAVEKANRGLDQAVDKSERAASSTMTAAANLNFLLSQLSPAERKLYEALQSTWETYRRIFQGEGTGGSGIYGVIIGSFTRAVEKVEKIMEMPKVISGIQGLADVIGENIDKIVNAVDPEMIDQLLTIIENAGENMGPLVDGALKLVQAFLNIQESANPAFADLIEYLGKVVDKILAITEDTDKMGDFFKKGEENLEAWLDLIQAVIGLLAVLVGASADEGQKSIEDLTKNIQDWTDWLEDHHDDVVGFFQDARKAAYAIGGVLENIAVVLAKSFSAERVEKFTDVLNKVVVPALGEVIGLVGTLTDVVGTLLDNPVAAEIVKWAIAFALLGKVGGPLVSMVGSILRIGRAIVEVGKFIGRFIVYFDDIIRVVRLFTISLGAPIIIIGAVVAAIVGLLIYFHKIDDIVRGLKDAFQIFIDAIQPALDDLSKALDEAGIRGDKFKAVLSILKDVGQVLADFITKFLIVAFKSIAQVLGGVAVFLIRTFTGVIRIIKGFYDILIGLFTGDWDQVLRGLEGLAKGIFDIFHGIVEGAIKILEGIGTLLVAPFKAAWNLVKKFFGVDSPSKKAMELGRAIIDGLKNGLVGLARFITGPFRRAWGAVSRYFDGKPQELAKKIIDALADGVRAYVGIWKRVASWLWGRFKDAFDAAKRFGGTIVSAIVDGIKSLPGELLKAIANIGGELVNVGKSIGNKIVEGIKSVVGGIKGLFGGGGDDDNDKPQAKATPRKPATTSIVNFDVGAGAVPFGAKDLEGAQKIYSAFWADLRRAARNGTDYIQRQFREMRIATTQSSDKMYKDIRSSLADIQNSFKARGGNMGDTWGDTWDNINKVAFDGLNYIGSQTNKMLKALAEDHINFGLTAPKKEDRGKATGGFIGRPGQRGRDMGLYALGAGEAVLNWAHQRYIAPAVEAFYGHPFEQTFDRVHAYHAGDAGSSTGMAVGGIVPIPGMPGESIHRSILGDVLKLIKTYKLQIYDGYAPTGHAAGGEHPKGLAIDAGPGVGGSWDLVDKLAKWAEPTQNNPRDPFRWVGYEGDPNHGRGNHIHLSWIAGKTIHGLADVATQVMKRMIVGPAGAFKTMLNTSIESIRKVANKFLGEKAAAVSPEGAEDVPVGKVGAGAGPIFKFFKQHGFTDEQAAAWVGNFQQESGLNPAIIQPNGEGHGLAQWGGGRFAALVAFAKAHGKPWQDMGTQLAFVMHELSGSESGAYRGIKAAKTVEQATNAIGSLYERYGIQGDRSGPARDAYRQFAGKFDVGGEIPGPDGAPVPILAHAREWVLNPKQQGMLASLIGTGRNTLKAMLGFTGGPFSFQGGGEIGRGRPTVRSTTRHLEDILGDASQLQSFGKALDNVRLVMRGINRLNPKIKGIADIVDVATKEGGLLDNLRSAIERRFAAANLRLRRAQLTVGAGRIVRRAQDDIEAAQGTLGQRRNERGALTRERREIQQQFDAVEQRRRRAKPGSDLAKELASQQILLQTRLDESNERVIQNTEDIFAAQEDLAQAQEEATQKRLDAFQAITDSIKDRFTRRTATNDLARRVATALGSPDLMGQVNQEAASIVTDNISALTAQMREAQRLGYTEQTTALQADIEELFTQATELAQQALRDQMEVISTAASREGSRLDLFGRMADALGRVGQTAAAAIPGLGSLSRGAIAAGRIDASRAEQAGYAALLPQAQAQGNVGLVQELTDKINELTVTIAEQTKSERDARFAANQDAFDYSTSINDLTKQLVEATDATLGLTSTQQLQKLAEDRLALYTNRTAEIQAQLLEAQLAGDDKAAQDLTKQLLENQIAVQQNTKAVTDLKNEGTAPSSYGSLPWQWFRIPLLSGTGSVLPQYQAPTVATSMDFGAGGGAMSSTSTTNGKSITTNIEINEAGQPIDVPKVAGAVVFAQATAH